MKKTQHKFALGPARSMFAADKLIVLQSTVNQRYRPPGLDAQTRTEWQSRSQYQRIEKIVVQSQELWHGAVIEWAR